MRSVSRSAEGETLSEQDAEIEALLRMLEPGPGASTPNIHAMSSKQFEKYLCKIRELRPVFRKYWKLLADAERRDNQESIWQGIPVDHANQFKAFLAKHAQEELTSPTSRVIEQQPQISAGLTYAQGSLLQSHLLTRPRRGRVVGKTPAWTGEHVIGSELRASFAGMLAYLNKNFRGEANDEVDWRTMSETGWHDPNQGVAKFRLIHAELRSVPPVVGEKSGFMQNVKLKVEIKAVSPEDLGETARRTPGTKEYSGLPKLNAIPQLLDHKPQYTRRTIRRPSASQSAPSSQAVLGNLSSILRLGEYAQQAGEETFKKSS